MDRSVSILGFVYGGSWLVTIAVDVAFVALAAAVVRRQRPDAFKPLLTWSIAGLAYSVFGGLANILVPRFMLAEPHQLINAQIIQGIIAVVVHVGLSLLLARGLVVLAQPRRPVEIDGALPYR